jgi:ribosomal 30S subunit maturation factor RimM
MTEYKNIATITRKIKNSGEVEIKMISPLDSFSGENILRPDLLVHLTPPPLYGIRRSRVERARESSKPSAFLVKFEDSNSAADAFELVGRTCLISTEDLPVGSTLISENNFDDLLNLELIDENAKSIGVIVEVIDNPAHPILLAESEDGTEVLVPLVEEFVKYQDEKSLCMRIPKGLLELNRAKDED